MSVKIRVSYQKQEELEKVLKLLSPAIKSCKSGRQQGEFKKVYIELNK